MSTSDRDLEASFEQLGRFFMGTSDVHLAMERLVQKLDELGIDYAICGGMALNAHGYKRATTDVNVLMTAEGLRQFKEKAIGLGWLEKFPGSLGLRDADKLVPIDILLSGGIPGDGTDRGVAFPDPLSAAVELESRKYVSLEKLIELKLASGLSAPDRPRDFDDVIQLIRVNALGERFADSMHEYVRPKYRELWGYAQRPTNLPE